MKVAFFDIGTNSIHMKVVDIQKGGTFEVLEHKRDMTRIGDGSFKSRKLSKRAMKRGIGVIRRFSELAGENGAGRVVALATSAVRDAKNGTQFIKEVRRRTGIPARVISGEEEGRLIFLGAVSGIEKHRGKVLVVDIGGGSAELVLGDRRKIDYVESLPIGVARLRDRFLSKNPPSKENLRGLENHIEDMVAPAASAIARKKFSKIIGTGGTLINLASIVYQNRRGRRLRLRGYFELKEKDLLKLHKKLIRLPLKRLKKLEGLDKKRADTIAAGSLLVAILMRVLKTDRIWVSDKGIREGMVLDYFLKRQMKMKNRPPSVRVQWFGQKPFFSGRIL